MIELGEPFKKDKKGLYYLSSRDVKVSDIYVPQISNSYSHNTTFYGIEGIDNYIIKDSTLYPYFNNRKRHLELLKALTKRQDMIDKVEFPVAYYLSSFMLKGIIIPYYKDYLSLRYIIYVYPFDELTKFYNQESNKLDNLISLFINILELVIYLFDNGINYNDVNTSNFLIYNNNIKVVDFEPGFVNFNEKNSRDIKKALKKYEDLINLVLKKYQFQEKFNSEEDFYSTEKKVLELRKRLER